MTEADDGALIEDGGVLEEEADDARRRNMMGDLDLEEVAAGWVENGRRRREEPNKPAPFVLCVADTYEHIAVHAESVSFATWSAAFATIMLGFRDGWTTS